MNIADTTGPEKANIEHFCLQYVTGSKKVTEALAKLTSDRGNLDGACRICLFCESGETFNAAMSDAAEYVNRSVPGATVHSSFVTTNAFEAGAAAATIHGYGAEADGVVVVAREHPAINSAIRRLENEGIPVVCLTSDLPSSRRSAYVGNDQYAAGSVARQLIGKAVPPERHRVLLATSVPFRSQQEREMGFRRVLRTEFPHLRVDARVVADDVPETAYELVIRYIESNGPPAAVYNVAGANRGVAMALEKTGCARDTIFVGHELTPRSRTLLEEGTMDYVISHDFAAELSAAATWIIQARRGIRSEPWISPILVHTRYNCEL